MKIIQICDDGTIYLVGSDEERPTPWEEDIKNVDALPIDGDLLRGFGFEKSGNLYTYGNSIFAVDNQLNVIHFVCADMDFCSIDLGNIAYMHELQQALHEERNFIETFEPEWKGIEK